MSKFKEKKYALELRRRGLSYTEILKKISVAKSTLSLWLREVGLSEKQKHRLTEKKFASMKRGWEARKRKRIEITKTIKDASRREIKKIGNKNLWLLGIALYWAEGAKEKEYRTGEIIAFSNSDSRMICFFVKWLNKFFLISPNDLIYELYIHETADQEKALKYWSDRLSISEEKIRLYFKRNKIKTQRKNRTENYYGLIRIKVKKSTNINRKISGWIDGVCEQCGIV